MTSLFSKIRKRASHGEIDKSKPGPYHCPLCNASGIDMLPIYTVFGDTMKTYFGEYQKNQSIHNIFLYETCNMANYGCSNCGASDKDRLYAMFLSRFLKEIATTKVNLLDIAPSRQLTTFLKNKESINYRSMDLHMEGVDDQLDITDMSLYEDGQFDFFICSHVLEHVPDDIKAMKELYRILKPGGRGIAMVPINFDVTQTMEEPHGTDIAFRWKYFGQDDHVRIYAKHDFIARLQSVGFNVNLLGEDYFTPAAFEKAAIYPTSVLYIVSK